MNAQEIISIISSLPTNFTERTQAKAKSKIAETANAIAQILTEKNLVIVKGSTSPTGQKSYARIYLETIENKTHDARHHDYAVIDMWEWQTRSKYGFSPISAKSICDFCDSLRKTVEAL